jgi:hypothetical protein
MRALILLRNRSSDGGRKVDIHIATTAGVG